MAGLIVRLNRDRRSCGVSQNRKGLKMRIEDYDTLNEIVKDLSVDDIEQLEEFAHDCRMVGARRTANYIFNQIRKEAEVLMDLIRVKLVEDCSGCY